MTLPAYEFTSFAQSARRGCGSRPVFAAARVRAVDTADIGRRKTGPVVRRGIPSTVAPPSEGA